jgi:hypothetical protein
MKNVDYLQYEFHGEPEPVSAPFQIFVYDVPYLSVCNVFPPLHILNQILESGGSEGGMSPGATWKPFRISLKDYEEVLPLVLKPNRSELKMHARYPEQQLFIDPEFDHFDDHLEWLIAVSSKHGKKRDNK